MKKSKNIIETYTLCGDHPTCCPIVEISEQSVVILDDYGGKVQLTHEEFDMMTQKGFGKAVFPKNKL